MTTQVNEQELKKKLAEWAGFRFIPKQSVLNELWDKLVWNVSKWVYPDGEGFWVDPMGKHIYLPPNDFIQSLDACIKWLVPKLIAVDLKIWTVEPDATQATVYDNLQTEQEWDRNPALALCLAIEKLIK